MVAAVPATLGALDAVAQVEPGYLGEKGKRATQPLAIERQQIGKYHCGIIKRGQRQPQVAADQQAVARVACWPQGIQDQMIDPQAESVAGLEGGTTPMQLVSGVNFIQQAANLMPSWSNSTASGGSASPEKRRQPLSCQLSALLSREF